ncbi:MAG TPA: HAD family hydrolase [Gammaproteobacteria bacterium]|nr:HAD family hydrolase [Gammaproteobacteria bacterium]
MPVIRLMIFDWDGTLMDSESHIVASMHYAMDTMGIDRLPVKDVSNIIGLGMREALDALFPAQADNDDFSHDFVAAYREYFFAKNAQQQFFDGALQVLQTMRERGMLLAVATGKSQRGLDLVLQQHGLENYFDVTRCADTTASKPDPLMLQEILQALSIPTEQAVMIGDTEYDLSMAANAGTHAIAANYGVHESSRLLRYQLLGSLDSIADLPDLMDMCCE